MFNGKLEILLKIYFIDISWRCFSGLFNSDKLLIFKFGTFKFHLKDNFVNN